MKRFAWCWIAAFALLNGCKKDVSGSYVASDNTTVCWLQLVRTPDERLNGQMVLSVLGSNGKIEHISVTLTGAVNSENITLTGSRFLGMAATTLSGTFNGNTLTLTGVQSTPFLLKRTNLAEYQAILAQQTTRSQAILAARDAELTRQQTLQAQRNFVAKVDRLLLQIQHFDTEADVHLSRFPNAEKSYEAITAKVSEYVLRERRLVGKPDCAVDRSQLDVAATQALLNTDQMHFQAQDLQSSLKTNIAPLTNQLANLEAGCSNARLAAELSTTDTETRQTACNRLMSAAPMFHQKYSAIIAGLNHLEDVYKREKEAQARLLAEAEKME
jgi:hypothetical protein